MDRYGGAVMRSKLPDKRPSNNFVVQHELASGQIIKLQVTVGFDKDWNVREVFCASAKTGSDNHALVMDACVLLSRLLQHGDSPADLVKSMCTPTSLIGSIAAAIMCEEGEQTRLVRETEEDHAGQPRTAPQPDAAVIHP